jgi:dihydrofolate synthase/folylpolyglutamate synthase
MAVFAMLRDKDMFGVAQVMGPCIDRWLVAPLPGPRGASAEQVVAALAAAGVAAEAIEALPSVRAAYGDAKERAGPNDRIVVFGSFHTVSEVLALRRPDIR